MEYIATIAIIIILSLIMSELKKWERYLKKMEAKKNELLYAINLAGAKRKKIKIIFEKKNRIKEVIIFEGGELLVMQNIIENWYTGDLKSNARKIIAWEILEEREA